MSYFPYSNSNLELARLIAAEWPLALVVSPDLQATQLPLVWQAGKEEAEEAGWLWGHMHGKNPQSETLAGADVLVVFNGPGVFQGEGHYAIPGRFPTYNYVDVKLWGRCEVLEKDVEKLDALELLTNSMEPEGSNYRFQRGKAQNLAMLPFLVAFRIKISRFENTIKVSQEKPLPDRQTALARLLQAVQPTQKEV